MNLSFSNIGWAAEDDERMYEALRSLGFAALEIAPPRFIGDEPYTKTKEAHKKAGEIGERYGLGVCSMQSIWFKKSETICGSPLERAALLDYTRQALGFADAVGCRNLVFGCPKNRRVEKEGDEEVLFDFFSEMCSEAASHGSVIAVEANPPIYGTNFLNDTPSAIAFARSLGAGASVNLDFGTITYNKENLSEIGNNLDIISHVHISEPELAPIERRQEHRELAAILREGGYGGFVSVEMRCAPFERAYEAAGYLSEVFA